MSENNFDMVAKAHKKMKQTADGEVFDITKHEIDVETIMARPMECFGKHDNTEEACAECKDLEACKLETMKESRDTPLTPEQEELRLKLGAFGMIYKDYVIKGFKVAYPNNIILKKDGYPSVKYFEWHLEKINDNKEFKLLNAETLPEKLREMANMNEIVPYPTEEMRVKSLADEENMKNKLLVQELRDEVSILSNSNDSLYTQINELQLNIELLEIGKGLEVDTDILRKMIPEFVRVAQRMKELTTSKTSDHKLREHVFIFLKKGIVIDTDDAEDARIRELLHGKPKESKIKGGFD